MLAICHTHTNISWFAFRYTLQLVLTLQVFIPLRAFQALITDVSRYSCNCCYSRNDSLITFADIHFECITYTCTFIRSNATSHTCVTCAFKFNSCCLFVLVQVFSFVILIFHCWVTTLFIVSTSYEGVYKKNATETMERWPTSVQS